MTSIMFYGSVSGAAMLLAASPVAAQQAAKTVSSTPGTAVQSQATDGIRDIIVTAQRKSENLQRAAIAVSAVSGDALRNGGVTRPTELTALVPALQVVTSSGPYSLFYLRGVGNFNGNALADGAVAFNVDGVYIGRPSSTTGFFYDLERVEVVKGPQGTLYGRNATGGAINVISHAPELGTWGAVANAEYGNYNTVHADAALNIPVSDSAALRVAGVYARHDGYMNDGTDDQNDKGGRTTLRLDPASNLKITIAGDYFDQRGRGAGSTAIILGPDNRIGLTSPAGQAFYRTQPAATAGRTFNGLAPNQYQRDHYFGFRSTVEWQVPIGTITLIPAYREGHLDFRSTTPGFGISQRETDKQFSFEGRLASDNAGKVSYIAGLFYYDERNKVPQYSTNAQYNASYQDWHTATRSMATFGRLGYAITDTLKASVGARYTTEDKTFAGNFLNLNILCLPIPTASCPNAAPAPNGTPPSVFFPAGSTNAVPIFDPVGGTLLVANKITPDNRASFAKATYRAGLEWQPTTRNLIYASFETGFKSGGFFFSADSGNYRPETIKATTIGTKNRFFNNRLQLNIEGFYWKYSNQQISHLGTDSTGAIIFPTENVGQATMKGFEVETQYLLTTNTLLDADVQYLDANYDSFVYKVPASSGPPLTGCSFAPADAGANFSINCSGRRPINAPAWTINAGIQQTFPLANGGSIVGSARTHYQTAIYTGLEYTPLERQGAYTNTDLSLTYNAPKSLFYVTGYVSNVENKTVVGNTFQPPLASFVVGSLRPPRTYGIRGGVKF